MVLWLIILPFAVLILAIVVIGMLRRLRPAREDRTRYDFEMEDLLRLRQTGQISNEEFERAKAAVLSRQDVEPVNSAKRGFEVLPAPRRPVIQPLEDRWSP